MNLLPIPCVRPGRSACRFLRSCLAALAVSAAAAPAAFADDSYSRRPTPRPGFADALLARSALAAIDADPELRGVNIVVSVVDRIAVIGGSVPTEDQSRRAELVVRRVAGIEGVKNGCFVQSRPDPLIQAVAERLNPTAARRPSPHDLPGMVRPPRPTFYPDEPWYPPPSVIATAPPIRATPSGHPVVSFKIPQNPTPRPSVLMDPIAPDVGPKWAGPSSIAPSASSPVPARLTAAYPSNIYPPALPARPAGDVLGRLSDLKRSEARFARLAFDLRDGNLVLTGSTPRYTDVWDFADAARRVAGVKQVFVGPVSVR